MTNLQEGMPAPEFKGKDQDGKAVSLKDFMGKKIILYSYPKDNTPGCTAEACDLRDNEAELREKGFVILGISADSEKSHKSFIAKYKLTFPLISDPDKEILRAYGAWGTKTMYGKEYQGILRKTYIIDEAGILLKIIDKVDTKNHSRQILDELSK